jgi:hypothetical protein
MQDQQAGAVSPDPWDLLPSAQTDKTDRTAEQVTEQPDEDLPDTDESGTGRRGSPQSGGMHPEHPVPEESPG